MYELIKDRATINEALTDQLCKNCTQYDQRDCPYCALEGEILDEEDNCLVNLVMGAVSEWDWNDKEDDIDEVSIVTHEKRSQE